MIIHNGIIKLDYNPTTDVLVTSMPDVRQFGLSEISFCLGLIVDSIKNYDIKYLLLDSSRSVLDAETDAYKAVTTKFAMDLMSTRLKRIARIGTADAVREEKSAKVASELREQMNLPVEFQNFNSQTEAMDWLLTARN